MTRILAILSILLLASTYSASDTISLAFDEFGSQTEWNATITPGNIVPVDIYVIAWNTSQTLRALEFGSTPEPISGFGAVYFQGEHVDPFALNVCDPGISNHCASYTTCFEPAERRVMARYTYGFPAGVQTQICLTGSTPSSFPDDQPGYVSCDLPRLVPLGIEGTGCITIDTTGTVPIAGTSWSRVKALYAVD